MVGSIVGLDLLLLSVLVATCILYLLSLPRCTVLFVHVGGGAAFYHTYFRSLGQVPYREIFQKNSSKSSPEASINETQANELPFSYLSHLTPSHFSVRPQQATSTPTCTQFMTPQSFLSISPITSYHIPYHAMLNHTTIRASHIVVSFHRIPRYHHSPIPNNTHTTASPPRN